MLERPRHPDRLIRTWRDAIEAAARRADIAIGGPYLRDDTVHHRRVHTLKQLAGTSPVQHRWLLRRLALFDKATARGNEADICRHGTQMVAIWGTVVSGNQSGIHCSAQASFHSCPVTLPVEAGAQASAPTRAESARTAHLK